MGSGKNSWNPTEPTLGVDSGTTFDRLATPRSSEESFPPFCESNISFRRGVSSGEEVTRAWGPDPGPTYIPDGCLSLKLHVSWWRRKTTGSRLSHPTRSRSVPRPGDLSTSTFNLYWDLVVHGRDPCPMTHPVPTLLVFP